MSKYSKDFKNGGHFMNTYFKKSTKRSVISMLSIAITLCLLFSLLFPGKAVNAAPRMRLNKTAVTLIQ